MTQSQKIDRSPNKHHALGINEDKISRNTRIGNIKGKKINISIIMQTEYTTTTSLSEKL